MTDAGSPSDETPATPAAPAEAAALRERLPAPLRVLNVEELAAMFGLTVRAAHGVLERGELPSFKLGRRRYCRVDALEEAMRKKEAEGERDKETAARMMRGLHRRNPDVEAS